MWLLLLLAVIIGFIGYAFVRQRKSQHYLQQRFNQVIGLRQLIDLFRFHRRRTHQALLRPSEDNARPLAESQAIANMVKTLLNQADRHHKPMYRILNQRSDLLLREWRHYSIQRNQVVHGKMIRHVLYLIDDTITQSLLNNDKASQFQHYQTIWPIILNALDTLSRYRYTIENSQLGSSASYRELDNHASTFYRRLEQINLQLKQPAPALCIDTLRQQLAVVPDDQDGIIKYKQQLYQYSLTLSDTLYLLFDHVLQDIADELKIHLPEATSQKSASSHITT
ncbi:hypothetical protein A3K86_05640 [Photobacterium jeanii]|uniref:Nitrate/nitrite sensing protein domain-containing protein n=1 Tax=Photobacterium jeanii TaxID=858640 RepID=A0A178KNP9_9GAMM|nr:hypothetical protein [Photobacterium jeanii]OAN18374.1 hypothetical protein A3K86_05640 [Photobacterium jeanii]PST91945.1 hypothetical protein C9I91_01830 [Photobacterium jeanii]